MLVLVRDDSEVQDCRCVLGVLFEGSVKFFLGVRGAIALEVEDAEGVVDFGARLEMARGFEAFFGVVEFALFFDGARPCGGVEVGGAEFGEAFRVLRTQGAIGGQRIDGGGVVFLFEQEDAKVVVGFDEVAIESERLLIGFVGFFGLAGALVGEAEEIPCLGLHGRGVFGEKMGGFFEFFDGGGVIAVAQEFFAFDDGARAGRAAGAEDNCEGGNQQERGQVRSPFFNGHHARAC